MYVVPEGNYLEHYGKVGMKWGQRRAVQKDATEFARAKMYYGEGAGNRRKLINATVASKSSKDPAYKDAFNKALSNQDMAKRAKEAKTKRHTTDAVNSTAKTARGVKNVLLGNAAYASTAAVVLVAGFGVAKKAGVDKIVADFGKKSYNQVKNSIRAHEIMNEFKKNGWN